MYFTTDSLLTSIKTRALIPTSQSTFQNSDLINFANEEMQIKLVPDLISIREDFFLRSKTVAITANNSRYPVPERCLGNALKDVFYLDANNNKYPIRRINIHDVVTNVASGSLPQHFYMLGDRINLVPTPSSATGSIEIWYYERPNQLALTASCAKITAINTSGANQVFTVDTDLSSSWSTSTYVDILSGKSPFLTWAIDCAVVGITSTTITVATSGVVAQDGTTVLPQVNDYVCQAQYANIPMIPQEAHPLLSEMVAARVVQALGDSEKLALITANINEMRKQVFAMCSNRVENALQSVINRRGFNRMIGPGWNTSFY